MSVIATESNNSENLPILNLALDNGDREKFLKAIEAWNFADEQSLLRFVVSVLLESNDKETIGIYTSNSTDALKQFQPASHLLKKEIVS